ncbi:MAG: hypothetical protein IH629_07345 [Thermoleophilia bacterium]|nr:hypothetical protein [Thermoleophilia bacterium]
MITLTSCTPVRGPRRRPVRPSIVDDELVWVVTAPVLELAAVRPSSPAALVHLSVQLAQDLAAANGAPLDAAFAEAELVDAAARAVAGYLDDLPDLPLVGEPFGGEEGTD